MELPQSDSTLIMITNEGMGTGDAELRYILINTYLSLLNDNDVLPGAICFYADGVKLVTEGSPVLDVLKSLEQKGVDLVLCNTCLKYHGLLDKIGVGIIGGMPDIITAQWKAEKVITL
ncbi:MAG: DsrE family protein [Candidatus Marinimicrobia bacterium]|nr:DsrE family protein [Candidatus Neomarinimicrobiota bacterium]MCF7829718.1 DsrE family protein [Candidatus Neomarinimicrobiota bacterium]MCF7881668.1 DsrE family protein [Candidatus Neomarinimicrobiota bacterium]